MSLIEKLTAALDETERIASLALRYRKFYLESSQLETWVARRDVNNHTPPYHDFWVVEAHLGELEPKVVLRLDALVGKFMARSFAATGAPFVLRQVAAHRKILKLHAKRDHIIGPYCAGCATYDTAGDPESGWPCPTLAALAEAYGIEVE